MYDVTQYREVLVTMDAQITTFKRKSGYRISFLSALFLGVFFLISLIVTGLLVYYFTHCPEKVSDNNLPENNLLITMKTLNIRLPKAVIPDSYELWLMPFIWEGNFTFHGEVQILINITENTNNVTLHATDLKINTNFTSIKEYLAKNNTLRVIKIVEQRNDTDKQFHVIRTTNTLRKGKQYIVYLKFIGYLNDNLRGFYRSSYTIENQIRWIAATQFEPTDARRAFPCFDEPALKARFQINIARPTNMTSISNMPMKGKPIPVSGLNTYVWDQYEQSLPMSTYLVAFVVSDFDVRKSEDGNFRVWARHDAIDQSLYSLSIGLKILRYYEDYFQIKYPLPKMDMIALPDSYSDAMENWGLITYRETAMLYDQEISNSDSKQWITTTISHELAHQWFGNLVTLNWWSDLWLNEGFAAYLENVGTNAVQPTWKILEQFVVHDLQEAFMLDALKSSHPVSVKVNYPETINEIFDVITYEKGASIIRMMDHFLTTAVFKKGLTNYLNKKAYRNAEQDDLWNALTKQAHKDKILDPNTTVKEIMDTWTLQTGFPLVTVLRNYNNNVITLIQEHFLLDNNNTMITSDLLWWIPITYTNKKQLNFNDTYPKKWMKAERSIIIRDSNISCNHWVLFNIQETGYYRVNYDKQNWQMIIDQLNKQNFKDILTINRAQLIDDAFNLARIGKLNYTIAFDIMFYLINETEYLPWKAASNAISFLNSVLIKTQNYDKFRLFILKLLDVVYKHIGFIDKMTDSQLTVFTRIVILSWACYFDHNECVVSAVQQFEYWYNTPYPEINNPIPPNLKKVVYCTAIQRGGQREWEFAWQQYLKTNIGTEKELLLQGLACTREIWLLYRYLDWAVTENSGIRKQDAISVFKYVTNNIAGQPVVFNYFRNNWAHLKQYFATSLSNVNDIIAIVVSTISTRYELKDFIDFAKEHLNEFGATHIIQQAVEYAESNILWIDNNYKIIREWLQKNIP